jgi:hypothetical protein
MLNSCANMMVAPLKMHLNYLPKYTNSRSRQVHPVNHPTRVSHITSNLVTYVLLMYKIGKVGFRFRLAQG